MATNSNSSIEERLAELEAENARLRDALARSSPAQRQRRSDAADLTFHAIADSIDQLIWTTLPDGYHDYFNRRWYEYTGMSEGSTDGEEWNGMFHPDDQERAWAVWRRCLDTGERYHIEYRLRHRSGEYRWVLGRAQPVRDESGAIIRWYGTCTDIHDLKLAEERLRESEARHARAIEAGQIGDYAWDLTTGEIRWSHNLMRIVGLSPDTEVTGEKVFELIHPDDRERVQSLVSRAIESGEQLEADYRVVGDDGVTRWVASRGLVERDEQGQAVRLVGVNYDTTNLHEAEQALRESEARFRELADHISQFAWTADASGWIHWYNRRWYDYTGTNLEQMQGWGWKAVHHPDHVDRVVRSFSDAIEKGEDWEDTFPLKGADGVYRWFLSRAQPIRDRDGKVVRWFGTNTNIDDLRSAETALRGSEAQLRLVLDASVGGLYSVDCEGRTTLCSKSFLKMLGFERQEDALGKRLHGTIHHSHPDGTTYAVERCPIYRCARTGEPAHVQDEVFFKVDGTSFPVEYWVEPFMRDGEHVGAICTFIETSERQAAEAALREESRILETLNETGAAIAGELELKKLVQMVTDAGVALTGAQFGAFFYNVLNDAGESYMLYTLSGARPDQFDFGMPRATAVFHPTFAGEGPIRSEDIMADPRYGKSEPHFGMPEGHLPVRSYLAVPVISRSGEVLGGLFFGHSEIGRFTERHERLIVGIAAQAAVSIDNARLYQAAQQEVAERQLAEARLRELNETLEQRVTAEIARRSEAEEALRQAQKMETLGQLTGGVAHDFNNLLQIVTGNLEILQRNLPADQARLRRSAENAMKGAERASILTQRLLAFSRRQPLAPKPVSLNKLVAGMSELLHRTLGETIEVETVLASGLWNVEADPNQLENALLNLAVNARDAMGEGGKLTIETSNTHLDQGYVAQNSEVLPGQYVVVCISDTGSGMEPATVERVFEPFFTTKDVGKGTGLGLSMVYGFVKQSGGHVKIYSEVGEGTTVKIYLPRLRGDFAEQEEEVAAIVPEGSLAETILVCEDDDDVRAYSVEVLRELGYRVLEAHDGPSALRLLERQEGRVDLLFTDVVLPSGMMGNVLAEQARALRPDLKVLFTTGYARNAIVHHGRLDPGVELITKPFSYADLAARIRDLLDLGR